MLNFCAMHPLPGLQNQGSLGRLGMKCATSSGLDKAVYIRTQGLPQVTFIDPDLWNCKAGNMSA